MCISSFFFFKQKTAYEMRISDWSSDVCSSDLVSGRKVDGSVLAVNERARTPGGENFEQHRVRDTSVEDDRRLDPRIDRGHAGLDLRDHAAGDRAVAFQSVDRLAVEKIGRSSCRESVCPYV